MSEPNAKSVSGGTVWSANMHKNSMTDNFAAHPVKVTVGLILLLVSGVTSVLFCISGFRGLNSFKPTGDSFDYNLGTHPGLAFIMFAIVLVAIIFGFRLSKISIHIFSPKLTLIGLALCAVLLPGGIPAFTASPAATAWVEEKYDLVPLDGKPIYDFTKAPVFMLDSDKNLIKVTFESSGSLLTLVKQEKVSK